MITPHGSREQVAEPVLHFDSKLTLILKTGKYGYLGEMHAFGSAPRLEIRGKGVYPLPKGKKKKIQWGCCPEMSTLLVTSMWQTIFCALANRDFASAPGSQSPEYNIPVVICCNCLFVLVSSVLLLALATAIPVAPRGHSYCTRASLLL